jgi:hypothetical protein
MGFHRLLDVMFQNEHREASSRMAVESVVLIAKSVIRIE